MTCYTARCRSRKNALHKMRVMTLRPIPWLIARAGGTDLQETAGSEQLCPPCCALAFGVSCSKVYNTGFRVAVPRSECERGRMI